MWEGILLGQHVKKLFFFTQTVFLKGFTSTAAGLCHQLQVETGWVLFFFLQRIMKRSSISVPELFPEMRTLECPGNSLFPASSTGKGLFPKGSVSHRA